jgi:putative peptidoglycan lipid II flippase
VDGGTGTDGTRAGAHERAGAGRSGRNAFLVGAGILLSRIAGLVRERVFAHYFGNSDAADAFKAALKIPNLLQNLFGEGALSASFIPVYARLLSEGDEKEARRVAHVIASLLVLAMSVLVLLGVLLTPFLIDLIAPGFHGEKREFTIRMVQILFPGVGILVLSAWCLGILNSHRKFFLPYAAPVLWNAAMIAALLGFGGRADSYRFAMIVAWGAVAGSVLQLAVQLPVALRLTGRLRPRIETASATVRTVLHNFAPSVATRGVNQLSSYVDQILASFLPAGAVAALAYAQTVYLLPVSLFGMAISSAELPEMSGQLGTGEDLATALRERLQGAMRRIAFFVIPSGMAFLVLGGAIVGVLFQTGRFGREDVLYVWAVLAGSTVGLLAATLGRLYASAFWALRDTRTPLRFAAVRVALTAALGWALAFPATRWIGIAPRFGLVGLTVSAGMAGWLEFSMLRRALNRKIGRTGLPRIYTAQLWGIALASAALGFGVEFVTRGAGPLLSGAAALVVYGACYFGLSILIGIAEATALLRMVRGRFER